MVVVVGSSLAAKSVTKAAEGGRANRGQWDFYFSPMPRYTGALPSPPASSPRDKDFIVWRRDRIH